MNQVSTSVREIVNFFPTLSVVNFYVFLLSLIFFVIVFEIIPIVMGKGNTLRKNIPDFFKYHIGRKLFAVLVFNFILIILYTTPIKKGLLDLTSFSIASQTIILYFFVEFFIYMFHQIIHNSKIPLFSKAHNNYHHKITNDFQWVSARKEHMLIIASFVGIASVIFIIIFKSSPYAQIAMISIFLFLNALSHFRIPFSVKLLDQVFLFPKDHLRHHTKRGGPYGLTTTIFDTIFNTRDE